MSYHARMRMPLLIVTARTGACGKTKRTATAGGSASSGTIGTKSLPSAPSPWSQMTLAVGCGAVSSSMQGRRSAGMGFSWHDRRAFYPAGGRTTERLDPPPPFP